MEDDRAAVAPLADRHDSPIAEGRHSANFLDSARGRGCYAKQNAAKHDDVAGPGNGFIDEFDTSGHFLKRFASGTAAGGTLTALNSPIGATFAPAGFGNFGGDLLIGNFGDSHVSVCVPAGDDAFDLLLVPGLVSDLIFQDHLEAEVTEVFRLAVVNGKDLTHWGRA